MKRIAVQSGDLVSVAYDTELSILEVNYEMEVFISFTM